MTEMADHHDQHDPSHCDPDQSSCDRCDAHRGPVSKTVGLLTADGFFVKFVMRSWEIYPHCYSGGAGIEYFVQMDGTREFGTYLPVESSTWGRVKSLYR